MTREMKNSGIEWIGDIPSEWKYIKIKYIYNIKKAKLPSEFFLDNSLAPYLTMDYIRGVNDNLQYAKEGDYCTENDLLLIWDGSNSGEIIFNHPCGYAPSTTAILKLKALIDEQYAKHYLKFFEVELRNNTNGMGIPHVDANFLKNAYILFPPLPEQKRIADFLDSKVTEIDKIISETKASIENYKEYKQSVITEAVTKGLDKNVPMKDSGIEWIGKIPCEWKVCKLKFFSKMISKGTTPKDMRTEIDHKYCVRYLKSENIVSNDLRLEPEFSITKDINEELKRSQLEINDILFVIAGASIGKTAIVPEEFLPANTNQAVSFIRLEKEFLDYKKYVWYFLQSRIIPTVIALYSVQSAQPNLSMENLGNIKLAISKNKLEIFKIVDYLDAKNVEIDNLISKKEKLITNLEEYKKSLIYEYVTGKKAVE